MNKLIQQGELKTINLNLDYIDNPALLFAEICCNQEHSLLLESAAIESKQNLKSIILIDAAIRIECICNIITLEALTTNGEELVRFLTPIMKKTFTANFKNKTLTLNLPYSKDALDEDTKLRQKSSLDVLRLIKNSFKLTQQPANALFIGGLFSFDLVDHFEDLPPVKNCNNCPDFIFFVAETLLEIDHNLKQSNLQATIFNDCHNQKKIITQTKRLNFIKKRVKKELHQSIFSKSYTTEYSVNFNEMDFANIVNSLKQYIYKGDIFQVVPSRKFNIVCPYPLAAYNILKKNNPSPYMFYLKDKKFTLFGASPESALKYLATSNEVEIYPIAGTKQRALNSNGTIDKDLDNKIEFALRSDKKELAEHMMLVDLSRNDLARVCIPGSREIKKLLQVDKYSHVMHLVSKITGKLRSDLDALHAYRACLNMGTLTGSPKNRAIELIRKVEQCKRGAYGGAVGYLNGAGDLDTCIVIRSAYVENGIATIQAGAGIVYDSIAKLETKETLNKAQAVISSIQEANLAEQ